MSKFEIGQKWLRTCEREYSVITDIIEREEKPPIIEYNVYIVETGERHRSEMLTKGAFTRLYVKRFEQDAYQEDKQALKV